MSYRMEDLHRLATVRDVADSPIESLVGAPGETSYARHTRTAGLIQSPRASRVAPF